MIARAGFVATDIAALAGSHVLVPAPGQADDTEFTIQVFCNDDSSAVPLAGVRVELWWRGLDDLPKVVADSPVRLSHAAADGRVAVRVSGDEEYHFFRSVGSYCAVEGR